MNTASPSSSPIASPLPATRIPRDIVSLFAACANPNLVNLDADPKPVPADAPMPDETPRRDADVSTDLRVAPESSSAAAVLPTPVDPLAHMLITQAKAMDDGAKRLLALAGSRISAAEFEQARAALGWPATVVAETPRPSAPTASVSRTVSVGADPNNVELRKFDRAAHKRGRINLVVGKRGTGKSVLLKDLLCSGGNQWDVVVGMSPTPESQDMLREMFPTSCVHDGYDGAVLERVVSTARTLNHLGFRPRVLLVLDDCMFDHKILRSTVMRDLHMNGRCLGIDVYNVVQYVMDVPKAVRSQIDYVFALCEPQRAYRESLYRNFFGIFPTYEEFSAAFHACTENFGCIVVDSTARTNAVEDSVFWYRSAPNPPAVLLGSCAQWRLHHMFYKDPKHAMEAALGDPIPALTRLRLVD
ncbi:hypothetical protein psal_cds_1223 [Pandoravirus salinus]|uniref:Uncharacterized protein n=1 Tax=Pandoravirus salinus TaxID=1349410 RepID=S4W4B2_9VIRU|nr:hypothetical protein psal_cds_1223 [Pandoravirus salinus]AGO85537.1 hypothetical protein psal_cds_1223 [Pandoravirus salinus]